MSARVFSSSLGSRSRNDRPPVSTASSARSGGRASPNAIGYTRAWLRRARSTTSGHARLAVPIDSVGKQHERLAPGFRLEPVERRDDRRRGAPSCSRDRARQSHALARARSIASGAMTSASLLMATTMARSPGLSARRNVCDACFARRSGSPAMLQLRSTPSATVNGNSPAVNAETPCSWLFS